MRKEQMKEYFLNLTPGKLNGLRAITDENGKFKVLALDQSNSFKKSLRALYEKNNNSHEPTYEEIRAAKMQITSVLSSHSTAVLLDVNYGLAEAINSGVIAKDSVLIGRLEASRDAGTPAEIESGWSVKQIKQIGCAAVKLLVYMDTEDEAYTASQLEFVKKVEKECQKEDILLMVEELSFPREGEAKESAEYKERKEKNILKSAELLGPHCDILKLEFPGKDNLEKLNEIAIRPWVLLSAGQPYNDFILQVKEAMEAGASGIMAGRAIFNDYFTFSTDQEKEDFLNSLASIRMAELSRIVNESAKSWLDCCEISNDDLSNQIKEGWYRDNKITEPNAVNGDY